MPAWTSWTPWCFPVRLPWLGTLPQREIARVTLGAGLTGVLGRAHVIKLLTGERAVLRIGRDVEVHIATRGVAVPRLDKPPHQHDHFRDVPGGTRLYVRREAAERLIGPGERALVALSYDPGRHLLLQRFDQDLVIHVSDVPAQGDPETASPQPAHQHVETDTRPHMTYVRRCLHGGAA